MAIITYIENSETSNSSSRYQGLRIFLDDNNNPVLESIYFLEVEDDTDDVFVKVPMEFQFRPDLIADKVYGNELLYWIVAVASNMIDPIAETYIGMKLRLPSNRKILEILEDM